MSAKERAANIIVQLVDEAKVDPWKAFVVARLFIKQTKEILGENVYYYLKDERRFGIKANDYWDRVQHFIDEIERKAIIEAADKRCKK